MFGKLLKYELKSNYKLFGILSLVALAIGLAGGGTIRTMIIMEDLAQDRLVFNLLQLSLYTMVYACMLGIGLYGTVISFINYYRFYKHKFTDEGYLTFTLPVKAESIFWSSFLNILFWVFFSGIVTGIAIMEMLAIGMGPEIVQSIKIMLREIGNLPFEELQFPEWKEVLEALWKIVWEGFIKSGFGIYFGTILVQPLIAPLYSAILTMTCITVGSVLVKKMKLLLSVGIYIAFTAVVTSLTQFSLQGISILAMFDIDHIFVWMSIPMVAQILLQLGVIVGGYFLCIHLMKKKLNLP